MLLRCYNIYVKYEYIKMDPFTNKFRILVLISPTYLSRWVPVMALDTFAETNKDPWTFLTKLFVFMLEHKPAVIFTPMAGEVTVP